MIRGHLTPQTYRIQRHGQTVTQGPYHLLQRREQGKNNCQRVAAQELDAIVAGVEAYKRYSTLSERYATLTEQMTWQNQTPAIKKVPAILAVYFPQTAAFLNELWTQGLGDFTACEQRLLTALRGDCARLVGKSAYGSGFPDSRPVGPPPGAGLWTPGQDRAVPTGSLEAPAYLLIRSPGPTGPLSFR
jgi:hypothetical protein